MILKQIIITALTSSVISALIGAFFQLKAANKAYKHEYYKLLLSKRIVAVELVEKVLQEFKTVTEIEGKICYRRFLLGKNSFYDLYDLLGKTITNGIWLDNEIAEKLTEFAVYLTEKLIIPLEKNKNVSNELEILKSFAVNNHQDIKRQVLIIEDLLILSLSKGHRIDFFLRDFKKRRKQKGFELNLE